MRGSNAGRTILTGLLAVGSLLLAACSDESSDGAGSVSLGGTAASG